MRPPHTIRQKRLYAIYDMLKAVGYAVPQKYMYYSTRERAIIYYIIVLNRLSTILGTDIQNVHIANAVALNRLLKGLRSNYIQKQNHRVCRELETSEYREFLPLALQDLELLDPAKAFTLDPEEDPLKREE